MQTIHIYIHFPEKIDDHIQSHEHGRRIIKDFQMTLNLADCEQNSLLYYSKTNKNIFFENISTLEELSDFNIGAYSFETLVNALFLENSIIPVKEDNDSGCNIKFYNTSIKNLDDYYPVILFTVVEKTKGLKEHDKQIILNLFGENFSQNPILIIVDCKNEVTTIRVPFITNFQELDNWLQENRLTWNFNHTDTRHIENSGNHKKDKSTGQYKSPLLGGIGGRTNAENLLKNAVGDKKSANNKEDLMNYDDSTNQYIWYEYENANNQYHAYHLVKAFSHIRDEKAIKRISDRVLKIFEYRTENREN